jgi:hypothetical protein
MQNDPPNVWYLSATTKRRHTPQHSTVFLPATSLRTKIFAELCLLSLHYLRNMYVFAVRNVDTKKTQDGPQSGDNNRVPQPLSRFEDG